MTGFKEAQQYIILHWAWINLRLFINVRQKKSK